VAGVCRLWGVHHIVLLPGSRWRWQWHRPRDDAVPQRKYVHISDMQRLGSEFEQRLQRRSELGMERRKILEPGSELVWAHVVGDRHRVQ